MSAERVGLGWGGGMDRKPGAGPPGIARDLYLVAAGVSDIRGLASDLERAEDPDRVYDFSIRWGTLMAGRLKRLEHYHRTGELTEDQARAYRQIKADLRNVGELAERLGLVRPPVPSED